MREVSIHDTLTGRCSGSPAREGQGGDLRLRAHRLRADHIGNARPFVVFTLLARFLGGRAIG